MSHRRTFLTAVAVLGVALLHTAPMQAQTGTTPPPSAERRAPNGPMRRGPATIDERITRMTADLGLSPDQASKIRSAMLAEQRSMDTVLARRTAARDAERAAVTATRTNTMKAVTGVLTADQKLRFDAMRARQEGGRGDRMGRGGRGGRRGEAGARGGRRARTDRDVRGPRTDRRGPPNDDAQTR
jgi:hypothetical protein